MYVSKRMGVAALAASALAGSAASAVSAMGDPGGGSRGDQRHGNRTVLKTSLAPSVPNDPALLGAAAGGVPWMLRSGEARLQSDGRVSVRIRGLLVVGLGTTGPVKTVSASLYCGASTTPVGTSGSVPLSSNGDARISTRFTLPAKCQIPALLIHPNGAMGAYIATSGFGA